MDICKIKLLLNTIKHLKSIQVYYRLYYFFRNKVFNMESLEKSAPDIKSINWESKFNFSLSYIHNIKSFTFLNVTHNFSNQIDWNYSEYGKLWTYNLNYFDFLNQEDMSKEIGVELINNYIKNDKKLKDGKEPYPISLRGINWVKFLSKYTIQDSEINKKLYNHYRTLSKNLEYHLLGNHLLENGFSLLFGAYFFQDDELYLKSKKILISELNEQILKDGAHFELSPMYHQIILSRVLDSIQLIKLNSTWKKNDLLLFLDYKASLMISWLQNITYRSGKIPMVNDATYNIAPSSTQLFSYAKNLGIINQKIPLSESGYRKIIFDHYELLIDIGNIGPNYQPAHAHSDSFNFELIKEGNPIFVDTGISTYEKNNKRQEERSTHSHNTVEINSKNQTQVWGGFRVANRAKITDILEDDLRISALHDGYKRIGFLHQRVFEWSNHDIKIFDILNKPSLNNAKAYFHLHSSILKPFLKNDKVILSDRNISISFIGHSNIRLMSYDLSVGFNKTNKAFKLIVDFDKNLQTFINLSNG
jgi:hypothetical protein